ncbi:MAG: arsenic resistance N-acetyltransferase ArsN2 [Bacteroidetes bacterium]|jgi:amino-acid N-acetyltransferase|nr:arsenic resistance N-acetyltransferase ArsN2 [Bacteroidota bacterium]
MHHHELFDEGEGVMDIEIRRGTREDRDLILTLLNETELPTADVNGNVTLFYVAEEKGEPVGIAGFEFYGNDALLRSVAVRPGSQRNGVGSYIVDMMLDEARKKGTRSVVLLTETARDFFLKKGFDVVDRSAIDNDGMKQSPEFTYACPRFAVCMRIVLAEHNRAGEETRVIHGTIALQSGGK